MFFTGSDVQDASFYINSTVMSGDALGCKIYKGITSISIFPFIDGTPSSPVG